MFAKTFSMVAVCLFAFGGCLGEAGTDDPANEDITDEQSALFNNWRDVANPPVYSSLAKAAVYNDGKTYFYYSDGWACVGTLTRVCDTKEYQYAVPGNVIKYMRGVGSMGSQFTAWYEHGYYSVGDAANLGSVKGMTPFSAAPFDASQMIDAINIPPAGVYDVYGGRWAFYWRDKNNPNLVWRTVGKVSDADYYEGPKQVQVGSFAEYGPIVGIDVNRTNGYIYTYYAKGSLNMSLLPLNLRSLD